MTVTSIIALSETFKISDFREYLEKIKEIVHECYKIRKNKKNDKGIG